MTNLKDQMKLLKDAGKGVVKGVKKVSEPFVKESVIIPQVTKAYEGAKAGVDKIIKKSGKDS